MKIVNYLEGMSEEQIETVGTQGQVVVISDDGNPLNYFDTVEEANTYVSLNDPE